MFELRTVGWHSQDDRTLVEKVKSISKPNDKVNFKIRLKQFDWAQIAFQNYSAKECEDRFNTLMKCVRPHRNLNEIAADVEITLTKSKLKKPLNSYQLFVQEQLTKVTTTGDFVSFFVSWTNTSMFNRRSTVHWALLNLSFQKETMKNMAKLYKELPAEENMVYKNKAKLLLQEYKSKKNDLA